MKYADRFFSFPIRIYDRYSAEKSEKEEEMQNAPVEGEWREGMARVELEEIKTWNDYFDSEQGPDGVDNDGFLSTLVFTRSQGLFICTLDMVTFEERMNEYALEYETWQRVRLQEKIDMAKQANGQIQVQ